MNAHLMAVDAVLGLALLVLGICWGALVVSSREEADQQRWIETMAAMGWQDWPAGDDGQAEPDGDGTTE
jgi:hypothetical protein